MSQHSLILGMGKSGQSVARYFTRLGLPFAAADTRNDAALRAEWMQHYPRITLSMGALDESVLDDVTQVIVSPGIALDTPIIRVARKKGIAIRGDIDLALHATKLPVVLITGSNGKSTVTALVGELLEALGVRAGVGGNFGTPALDLLETNAQVLVLEVSSFQLESTHFETLPVDQQPVAATVLNVSQDHLDRHGSLAHYADIKARVLSRAHCAVLNQDDPIVAAMADKAFGDVTWFGAQDPDHSGDFGLMSIANERWLVQACHGRSPEQILPVRALGLVGLHNQMNVMAALALVAALIRAMSQSSTQSAAQSAIQDVVPEHPLNDARLLTVLRRFTGLPHRAQCVGVIDGVTFIDDSKATNVGAAVAAIQGMAAPLVLIAGGQGKGQDFEPLAEALVGRCAGVVLMGVDQSMIAATLQAHPGSNWPICRVHSMVEAVQAAAQLAPPQSTVLLAPACASLDMFSSYVDRGLQFAAAVDALSARWPEREKGAEVAS